MVYRFYLKMDYVLQLLKITHFDGDMKFLMKYNIFVDILSYLGGLNFIETRQFRGE